MKCFQAGDVINVFTAPRTVRRYNVKIDGSLQEVNVEKPLKTIDPVQLQKDMDRLGWGYEL